MNRQQKFLNTLLKEIHEICVKNDITYYIAGGTLIGALRHEGFLPWDDDADVFMTETEFNKFVEACKTDLPPNRALRTPADLTYNNALPRYVSTDTTSYHSYQILDRDDVAGEVIDVFVLYPISGKNLEETVAAYTHDTLLYSELINYSATHGRRYDLPAADLKEMLDYQEAHGKKAARQLMEDRLAKYVDPDGEYYIMRWCGIPLVYEKQWFDEVEIVKYEDIEVMAPTTSNMYLTAHYGDEWSYLPPAAEEGVHRTTGSLDFPYTEALQYFTDDYDFKKIYDAQYKRKLIMLESTPRMHKLVDHRHKVRGTLAKLELDHAIAANPEGYRAAVDAHDGKALAPFFTHYFAWQLARVTIGRDDWNGAWRWFNPVLGPIDDETFQAAVEALLFTERIGMAWRLLFIKEKQGGLTPGLETLKRDILAFRKSVNLFQARKLEEGQAILSELLSRYPEVPGFKKLQTCYLDRVYQTDGLESSFEALIAYVEKCLKSAPDDGFYLKYRADKLSHDGNAAAAQALYEQAAELTFNGMTLLDIKKKTGYIPAHQQGRGEHKHAQNRLNTADVYEGAPQRLETDGTPKGNDLQIALFDLLCELTSYLDEHQLDYVLDNTLCRDLFGFGMLPKNMSTFIVYMKADSLLAFIRQFNAKPWKGRALEHMGSNVDLDSRNVSFVNTETTWYDLRRGHTVKFPGLRITIKLLEAPGAVNKVDALLGTGWSHTCYRSNALAETGKTKFCKTVVKTIGHGKMREKLGKHLLRARLKAATGETPKYLVRNVSRGANYFPASLIDDTVMREFAGHSFRTVRDLATFEKDLPFFMSQGIPRPIVAQGHVFASANVPFKEFLSSVEISDKLLQEQRQVWKDEKYERDVHKEFKDCFAKTAAAIGIKQLDFDLTPRKAELAALEAAGKYEELYREFLDYRTLMFESPNAAHIDFDPELFGMVVRTLRTIDTRECRTILQKNAETIETWEKRD